MSALGAPRPTPRAPGWRGTAWELPESHAMVFKWEYLVVFETVLPPTSVCLYVSWGADGVSILMYVAQCSNQGHPELLGHLSFLMEKTFRVLPAHLFLSYKAAWHVLVTCSCARDSRSRPPICLDPGALWSSFPVPTLRGPAQQCRRQWVLCVRSPR